MKFWSKVEFACHFGKIHPPLQYIEIHLSWWIFQLAAILDCPLPYSPIWWIQFQFDPWRFANFIAIRSWNKGCNGRITWKAPLGCRIDASPLPWIHIHILHQTIDVDDKNPAPVDKVISLFKAVDASQFIQDVFHQQCGPSHLFLKTAVALSSTWVSNSRNLLVFQHLNAFGSPNTWNSFHHVGYCKITSFFQDVLGPLRFNATFLPEKKKNVSHHWPPETSNATLVMGQVKTTSPPPKGGAPRFKIWRSRRNWVEKLSIRRQSHCGFWGKTGIKSLPLRSCEPRNCFQKKIPSHFFAGWAVLEIAPELISKIEMFFDSEFWWRNLEILSSSLSILSFLFDTWFRKQLQTQSTKLTRFISHLWQHQQKSISIYIYIFKLDVL